MYGVISDVYARGIRKSACLEAQDKLDGRLKTRSRKRPPKRRGPWLRYWCSRLLKLSGDLAVDTFRTPGRRPRVTHLAFEPLALSDAPQGLRLVSMQADFGHGEVKVATIPVQVTGHALERMIARGNLRSTRDWVSELRPAVLLTLRFLGDDDFLDRLRAIGDDRRVYIPTRRGYAIATQDSDWMIFTTWLHLHDLSASHRLEAAMQEAMISAYVPVSSPITTQSLGVAEPVSN